jgi:hypothetical protein
VFYQETFRCVSENVARPDGFSADWYDSGDFDQISALYHYLEAIYIRFDLNHDGYLDQNEAMAAYPVLKQVLKDTAAKMGITFLKSDEDFQAVLMHLLSRGTIPSTQDWSSVIDFGIRRYIYASNFKADRSRVLQVR